MWGVPDFLLTPIGSGWARLSSARRDDPHRPPGRLFGLVRFASDWLVLVRRHCPPNRVRFKMGVFFEMTREATREPHGWTRDMRRVLTLDGTRCTDTGSIGSS
jgi:hypothetical protein